MDQEGFYQTYIGMNGSRSICRIPFTKDFEPRIFLKSNHELYRELEKLRKRPSKKHPIGKIPKYSDQLAVKCAFLHISGKTYLSIAKIYGLPYHRRDFIEQSETVRHLVKRGKKLLKILNY